MPSGIPRGYTHLLELCLVERRGLEPPNLCIANIGDGCHHAHDKTNRSDCPANSAWPVDQWGQVAPASAGAAKIGRSSSFSATATATEENGRIKKARDCGLKRLDISLAN